ncbi:MAG: hypothetical protein NZ481_04370 [Candidatus Kapabacteria bacterium]|nr:hypothetical protein [Candidatus Kapabacteria bacterium]
MRNQRLEIHLPAGIAGVLLFAAAMSRLIPHPPNFAPVTAMAVFAGWTFPSFGSGVITVLGTMLVSDTALALVHNDWGYLFHSMLPVVYGTFVLIITISRIVASVRRSFIRGIGSLLLGSTIFFVVTNFFVWALGTFYPHTWEGLLTCYAMAVPFYHTNGLAPFELVRNALAADLLYGGMLFSLQWGLQTIFVPTLQRAR